jgi:hypothetical protein
MLSKKDKEWLEVAISRMVEKAVVKALTVEMTWERALDDSGNPLAAKELKTENVYLPSFWLQHLKYHEGVYRGMRKNIGEQRDKLSKSAALNKGAIIKLEQIRKVFKGMRDDLLTQNRFSASLIKTGLLENMEKALAITMVEDTSESPSE